MNTGYSAPVSGWNFPVTGVQGVLPFTDGSAQTALSPSGTGALRYNNSTHVFEASVNGGAWASLGGGSGTVTNVATDATLTGGPISTTGTLGINLSNANTWGAAQTMPSLAATNATNQLTLGTAGHVVVVSSTAPAAASQTLTIPDTGGADTFAFLGLAQTFTGVKTFSAAPVFGAGATASGSATFDLSGSSGGFNSPTGTFALKGAAVTAVANTTITGAASATNTIGVSLAPNVADGGSSVALDVNNGTTLATAGSLLFQLRNNNTLKFSVDFSGTASCVNNVLVGVGGKIDTSGAGALGFGTGTATSATIGRAGFTGGITHNAGTSQHLFQGTATTASGFFAISPQVVASGTQVALKVTTPANTAQTAGTEINAVNYALQATRTWASNTAIATQREFLVQAPTYAFASAGGAITTAATLDITGAPIVGANAAITNSFALRVESGAVSMGQGTVAQATNVNTGVTVNAASGVITTQTATTAANAAEAGFTVTNSAVVAASVVVARVVGYSGTYHTNGQPDVEVTSVSAGSFACRIVNRDGTNPLNGTMKIHFIAL